MYEPSYKSKIILTTVILMLSLLGLTGGDKVVPIFFIIISILSYVVILTDYIEELKNKINQKRL
jgi:hypothetical protein